jgi:hypothetical protein
MRVCELAHLKGWAESRTKCNTGFIELMRQKHRKDEALDKPSSGVPAWPFTRKNAINRAPSLLGTRELCFIVKSHAC